jgi:transposase
MDDFTCSICGLSDSKSSAGQIARWLRRHRELMLNYFRAQKLLSSGVVEGLNSKARVTMRRSYGFRAYRVVELALYHSLASCLNPSPPDFF